MPQGGGQNPRPHALPDDPVIAELSAEQIERIARENQEDDDSFIDEFELE